MTLREALDTMWQAGFRQVKDRHSRFPRDIAELLPEASWDLNDYTPDPQTGEIRQNHSHPCNHFLCS